jgi:phospholipid/cholesterol/gamma-HCH transport system substrate-binding protein
VTFQNAQKITSDLDELTGDPAFRDNLRELVNGLSGLVSSTQQLQQQIQVAESLDSVKAAVNNSESGSLSLDSNAQPIPQISTWDRANLSTAEKSQQPIIHPARTSRKMVEPPATNSLPPWLLQLKQSSKQ